MKKPKIKIEVYNAPLSVNPDRYWACVWEDRTVLFASEVSFDTKKAAREWAKERCRTVGAALLEKGR